jgi:hypothetical protein
MWQTFGVWNTKYDTEIDHKHNYICYKQYRLQANDNKMAMPRNVEITVTWRMKVGIAERREQMRTLLRFVTKQRLVRTN